MRTTSYHEIGGGNAANTATAMARLSRASMFADTSPYRVKLCTKVGDDAIGRQCIDELELLGVDISSPLFLVGAKGTTTSLTNVIVSEKEHTRTCIHTPGTCGELTVADIDRVNLDEVFFNVRHLHSDCRHTDAALMLVREAKRRGITVSIDAEKDRSTKSLDCLLDEADLVFTNSGQIEMYLNRLMREFEEEHDLKRWKEPNVVAPSSNNILGDGDLDLYAHVVKPSSFFTRRCRQQGKEIVVTRGAQGAVSVVTSTVTERPEESEEFSLPSHKLEVVKTHSDVARVHQIFTDCSRQSTTDPMVVSASYDVCTAGVLTNIKVVDTTGAGDSFIGGFLLMRYVTAHRYPMTTCLQFGGWVGGRKLQGFGARSALPTAIDVDSDLGTTPEKIICSLRKLLSPFSLPTRPVPLVASWESFDAKQFIN